MSAIFRCDATADTGFGHLSRCIALAEGFRLLEIDSIFAGFFDPAAKEQVAAAKLQLVDLDGPVKGGSAEIDAISRTLDENTGSFVILDSYRADETYLADLKALGSPLVVIDDFRALSAYPCDVIFNFTWDARALVYPEGPVLLLGPEYFPARRRLVELRAQSIRRDRSGEVRNLFIAIGGSDPKRIAARLVRILGERHSGICLRVLATNDSDLTDGLNGFSSGSRVIPRQPDLSEQLAWADACITGGGLIKYESAFMGVPAAAISQNEGQAGETRTLTRAGLVFDLGLADDRSDAELGMAMDRFLADDLLREGLARRVREAFPSDPSAHAASAIAKAVGR